MGMDAFVVAVGKYHKDISKHLTYPPEHYEDVAEGDVIVTTLLNCVTSDQSSDLAEALGTRPWDLGKHRIDTDKVNEYMLLQVMDQDGVDDYKVLKEHGFTFYFLPNG